MMRVYSILPGICLFFFFLLPLLASAQDLDQLKQERLKTLEDIDYTNKLIAQTGTEKKASLQQLNLLNSKLRQQEKLISQIQNEIKAHQDEVVSKENEIEKLRFEMKQLKQEYAAIIYSLHKNKHDFDKWLFIFSAKDFNQAYKRLKYLEQYSNYRKQQADLILRQDSVLKLEIDSLQILKKNKEQSLDDLRNERLLLDSNQRKVSNVLKQLKTKESELKKELKKKEANAAQIRKTIESILDAERKKALKSKSKLTLTPEEQLLSNDFSNNRGNFPWPTAKGIITSPYGEQAHPVLRGIKINNTGVDITTEEGSQIRAIFDGEVRDVWSIKGKNMAIIIKHGEYFSVYQNLVDVKVKTGDMVETKQVIGTVYSDDKESDSSVIHLEIWKGSSRENPELWLAH